MNNISNNSQIPNSQIPLSNQRQRESILALVRQIRQTLNAQNQNLNAPVSNAPTVQDTNQQNINTQSSNQEPNEEPRQQEEQDTLGEMMNVIQTNQVSSTQVADLFCKLIPLFFIPVSLFVYHHAMGLMFELTN
jgi:hypothetical protein